MKISELKEMKVWTPWLQGQGRKIPSINGVNYLKWSDSSLLMTYDTAKALLDTVRGLVGVGFVVPNGVVVCDFDVKNGETDLAPSADTIIESLNSYTERSPSGHGVHAILGWPNPNCYSKLATVIDGQSVEIITEGNFVTFTGDAIRLEDIEDRSPQLEKLYSDAGWKRNISQNPNLSSSIGNKCSFGVCPYAAPALQDEVARIRKAKKGHRTKTILGASRRMGRLLPEGHLDENVAIAELERAGEFTGLNRDTPGKVQKTVAAGIEAGKKTPKTSIHSYRPIRLIV